MSGANHVSANAVTKDPLSSGEPEVDELGRDAGSVDEADTGMKDSPLLAGP